MNKDAKNTTGTVTPALIMGMHATVVHNQIKRNGSYFHAAVVYGCLKSIAGHIINAMKS
jgi:hypothetical protein